MAPTPSVTCVRSSKVNHASGKPSGSAASTDERLCYQLMCCSHCRRRVRRAGVMVLAGINTGKIQQVPGVGVQAPLVTYAGSLNIRRPKQDVNPLSSAAD